VALGIDVQNRLEPVERHVDVAGECHCERWRHGDNLQHCEGVAPPDVVRVAHANVSNDL
jgi:hypothetical protein